MKQIFSRKPMLGFRVACFLIVSFALPFFQLHSQLVTRWRSALTFVVYPIEWLVNAPIQATRWIAESMMGHQALLAENTELRANQFLLEAKLQRLIALETENNQLRQLLQSTSDLPVSVKAAEIMAVSLDPARQEVIINVGNAGGAYFQQPVLDAYGIMGQVVDVGPLTSKVLLISDPRSAVPVQDARSGVRAIAVGNGAGELNLVDVPTTEDIQMGDLFVSSGLGGGYPTGYPVGKVVRLQTGPNARFSEVELVPSARLNRAQQVLLVGADQSGLEKKVMSQLEAPVPVVGTVSDAFTPVSSS